ncbi:MAG: type IV pilus modification PilV family protein [Candidatus Rifleibacteriota bacterium]
MRNWGMSLVEILVASTILVAALVPLWGLLGSSHKQITVSADEVRASQIANEILEQIENAGWASALDSATFKPVKNSKIKVGGKKPVELSFGDFPDYLDPEVEITMVKYPAGGSFSGRIIRLELSYKSKEKVGTAVKKYQISTFVSG